MTTQEIRRKLALQIIEEIRPIIAEKLGLMPEFEMLITLDRRLTGWEEVDRLRAERPEIGRRIEKVRAIGLFAIDLERFIETL